MALNYEVKKRVFGFDKTKTEKYVAQLKTLGMVEFGDLCDEVTKVGMAPRGVVKMVLELTGEVITTPFTFASITHAIVRNGLTPVFCDKIGRAHV